MWLASSLSWLRKPESLVMSMLLVMLHCLWSIIDDSGAVVSSVVSLPPALLSFHMLARNLDRAHHCCSICRCAIKTISQPHCLTLDIHDLLISADIHVMVRVLTSSGGQPSITDCQ